MNRIEFQDEVSKLFPFLKEKFFDQVEDYKCFLQLMNQEFNLTKLDKEEDIYGKYFYESLVPYASINLSKINTVLDIGSGSGIPGILLKLAYPHIKLTIIEATGKKVIFMKELVDRLQLKDVTILHQRAEAILTSQRETFDLVTSRAVGELKVLLEISAPYAKVNGLIVEPKSSKFAEEEKNAKSIIKSLDLVKDKDFEFKSYNDIFHHVFVYKKVSKTNLKYPRSWKEIIK